MRRYLSTADFVKLQLSSDNIFERDEVVVTDNPAQPIYTFNSSTKEWEAVVTGIKNAVTGYTIKTIWNGTQAEYDAIAIKDDNTLYVIV